jgi:hypothetical protein
MISRGATVFHQIPIIALLILNSGDLKVMRIFAGPKMKTFKSGCGYPAMLVKEETNSFKPTRIIERTQRF